MIIVTLCLTKTTFLLAGASVTVLQSSASLLNLQVYTKIQLKNKKSNYPVTQIKKPLQNLDLLSSLKSAQKCEDILNNPVLCFFALVSYK